MIDELPILAIAASCAEGETVVSDSAELHHKESDRIYTLTEELSAIGIRIKATEDGFIISGNGQGQNNGGAVCHHNDHRLALSLAVAGLVAHKPILIPDAEIMDESFPKFHQLLELLGANIYEAQN
jgi:3-phosphoshikimate 1-carboxyvinyltransferase